MNFISKRFISILNHLDTGLHFHFTKKYHSLRIKSNLLNFDKNKSQQSTNRTLTTTNDSKISVVFFGTDLLSIQILKGLHSLLKEEVIHEINVVTSASPVSLKELSNRTVENKAYDLSNFRGNQIIEYCHKNSIKFHLWSSVRREQVVFSSFDVGVVASFGHLIPSDVIESFP